MRLSKNRLASSIDLNKQRGTALVAVMVVFIGLLGIVHLTTSISGDELRRARRDFEELRVKQLAESGIQDSLLTISQTIAKTNGTNPLDGVANLFGGQSELTLALGTSMLDGTEQVGAYTTTLEILDSSATTMTLEIRSTGYVPDAPVNLPNGQTPDAWHSVAMTLQLELGGSEVFDYAYFINNWGWFYGNTIIANGNARSNGQFDVAGYHPTVTGQPLYDTVNNDGSQVTLSGYHDDNGDGLEDGNDGGVFSGWDILDAGNLQGNGGLASNQHDFQEAVEMPNLSNMSVYETKAIDEGSRILVAGNEVTNGVFGDESGEQGNLYLVGTLADPIELDGPVVVRGDVIISGYVTGQGSIYTEGNVYVPDSIHYVDGPTTDRPVDNTQAATESWLTTNKDKDFLGLFARENVVVGDHTDSTWRYYVGGWMSSSMNKSEEDAGADGIPNTAAGKDGISGTADDDVLEDDGVFTVLTYTADDQALNLIPTGFAVGDAIPGSGEDIDGDGVFDSTTGLAELDFSTPLNTTYWGGNMPSGGISDYSNIASLYANNLDATFYTNHSFCYTVFGSADATINGAVVSRNENIVYGTPNIVINYDNRLLGGTTGIAGDMLPRVIQPATIIRWETLNEDPNHYMGMVNP